MATRPHAWQMRDNLLSRLPYSLASRRARDIGSGPPSWGLVRVSPLRDGDVLPTTTCVPDCGSPNLEADDPMPGDYECRSCGWWGDVSELKVRAG